MMKKKMYLAILMLFGKFNVTIQMDRFLFFEVHYYFFII